MPNANRQANIFNQDNSTVDQPSSDVAESNNNDKNNQPTATTFNLSRSSQHNLCIAVLVTCRGKEPRYQLVV
ncbi:unnamed protein product [Soboliphyme baturini]|uniref:Uncharacterized protein n=1 Tax=Soboliphyme baturini TaxID=241478 RepID=A0A183ID99_9BILA|nr:unnamed protein product [Soboliphyme baturini]